MSVNEAKRVLLPILLAEDDENDVFLMEVALQKAGISNPLIVARDGVEAVDYLKGEGAYSSRELHPLPGLILLDLKMPRMNGFDVLTWLQSRPELSAVPVVVFSSSQLESDMERAQTLGAREYRVKTAGTTELRRMLEELHARWLCGSQESRANGRLSPEEKQSLATAILTIADPKGNWALGWKILCELAEIDPEKYPSPFRERPVTKGVGRT